MSVIYNHCPYCGKLAEYNHQDGRPVCRCTVKGCKGRERWLAYDEFDEQRIGERDERNTEVARPVQSSGRV